MENKNKILLEKGKNFYNIILNHPEVYNALDIEMADEILKILSSCTENFPYPQNFTPSNFEKIKNENKIPKILYLSCKGDNFCTGGNLISIYKNIKNKELKKLNEIYKKYLTICFTLQFISQIKIVEWKGYVMGTGIGISINSQIRIATENTIFSMPECQIGCFPDQGASYFFQYIFNNKPHIGLYAGLTGLRIKGKDLINYGIATHFVNTDKLDLCRNAIKKFCFDNLNFNVEDIKKIILEFGEESNCNNFNFSYENVIKDVFIADSIYNIYERLENKIKNGNDEEKKFCMKTLDILNNECPESLIVFTELFKRAKNMKNINECYIQDEICMNAFFDKGEFHEGIRAILIDRDKKFNFKHKTIYDIKNPDEVIKQFIPS